MPTAAGQPIAIKRIAIRPRDPDLAKEQELWRAGYSRVAGVDEVGRGPLAGPVFAAAVILVPDGPIPAGARDSKQLSPMARLVLAPLIWASAAAVGLGAASVAEIDRLGISKATHLAMCRALAHAGDHDYVLLDGLPVAGFEALIGPYTALVGGDASSGSIACASVLAKVARDQLMVRLNARHMGYGWEHNAGYGTPEHLAALAELGPSAHHRRSFEPLRSNGANF